MRHSGYRILPDEFFGRHVGTEITHAWTHIAVGQFEPRAGEGVSQFFRMFKEVPGDGFVNGIHPQGEVCSQHHRCMALGGIVCIGYRTRPGTIFRLPLMGTCRTFGQFPFKSEQVLEVVVAPLRWCGCPGTFQAAGNGVAGISTAKGIFPTHALLLQACTSGFCAHIFARVGGTVVFPKSMSAGNQRYRFFVIHGHAAESLPDVAGSSERIRHAVGAFRIHINEAHLHSSERILQLAVVGIPLVAQPLRFRTPVNVLLWLPNVLAATTKPKRLATHRLHSAVAREHHQIGPRYFMAVFLFDRPKQQARFVEVGIIRPAVEGRKTLGA